MIGVCIIVVPTLVMDWFKNSHF